MIVPGWVYWVAIAALAAAVFGQQARVANAKRETSEVRAEFDRIARERAEDLAKYRQEKADLAAAHAAAQQETVDEYQKKLRLANDRVNERSAMVGRLRAQLADFATLGRTPGDTDTAVIQRAGDRLQALGGLLDEGIGLVAEGAAPDAERNVQIKMQRGRHGKTPFAQRQPDRESCPDAQTTPGQLS